VIDWDAAEAGGYMLPSHQQWLWAAMGASMDAARCQTMSVGGVNRKVNVTDWTKPFSGYNGSSDIGDYIWYSDTRGAIPAGELPPVGAKKANELGVYDMSGLLWEVCYDTWYRGSGTINLDQAGLMGDRDFFSWGNLDERGDLTMGGSMDARVGDIPLFNNRTQPMEDVHNTELGLRVIRYAQAGE
jgi:hypothetical protein